MLKRTTPLKRTEFKNRGTGFKRPSPSNPRDTEGEPARGAKKPKGARLRAKPDRELAAWGRQVKARDGNQCQWPGVSRQFIASQPAGSAISSTMAASPCATGDTRIDPHHIAPRGRRPDLIYTVANGICLCRWHHDWCHDNPRDAERSGLLNCDSYELAQKIKAGYVVPGHEDDHGITL